MIKGHFFERDTQLPPSAGVVRIRIVSFDWNCPKYITRRFTAAEVNELIAPLKARIAELESQLKTR